MNKRDVQRVLTSCKFDPKQPQLRSLLEICSDEYAKIRAMESIHNGALREAIVWLVISIHKNETT